MADMLEAFVQKVMDKRIKKKYPHIQHPSAVYANVSQVKKKDNIYICTLRILDKNLNTDNSFPEIPGVKTHIEVKKNDRVVVLLLYAGTRAFIAGRDLL